MLEINQSTNQSLTVRNIGYFCIIKNNPQEYVRITKTTIYIRVGL